MQYGLCDVWCVMCDVPGLFFVRSWLFESRGDQKYPIWIVSGLLSDSPKLTPGGNHKYTLSCKGSYGGQNGPSVITLQNIFWHPHRGLGGSGAPLVSPPASHIIGGPESVEYWGSEVYWPSRTQLNQMETYGWTDKNLKASCRPAPLWSGNNLTLLKCEDLPNPNPILVSIFAESAHWADWV